MSNKVKSIKTLYDHGRLTKAQIKKSVPSIITASEYEYITGEVYKAAKAK